MPAGKKDRVDIPAVQQACGAAWYLVGIFPVRTPEVRERRASLNVRMDLHSLLTAYFAAKPELLQEREELIKKIVELEAEFEHESEKI